jgi:hypothetical protein
MPACPTTPASQRWARGEADFSVSSGLATANGRPQRAAILRLHADALGLTAPSVA